MLGNILQSRYPGRVGEKACFESKERGCLRTRLPLRSHGREMTWKNKEKGRRKELVSEEGEQISVWRADFMYLVNSVTNMMYIYIIILVLPVMLNKSLNSLCLSFLICRLRIIIVPTLEELKMRWVKPLNSVGHILRIIQAWAKNKKLNAHYLHNI